MVVNWIVHCIDYEDENALSAGTERVFRVVCGNLSESGLMPDSSPVLKYIHKSDTCTYKLQLSMSVICSCMALCLLHQSCM